MARIQYLSRPSDSTVLNDSTDRWKEEDTGRCPWLLMPAEPGPTPNRRQSATAGVRASDSEVWDDQVSLPYPRPPSRTILPVMVMHSLGDTKTENVLAIPSVWNSHSPAQIIIHFCHQISPSQKDHLWLPYMKHHFPVFPFHVTLFDIHLFIYLLIICLSCHPHFRR